MDDDDEEVREEELRRLTNRFHAAVAMEILVGISKRQAGLDHFSSDDPRWAFCIASEFNLFARLCSTFVIFRIIFAPVVSQRLRRIRQESEAQLVLGFICLVVSLTFIAILRWCE